MTDKALQNLTDLTDASVATYQQTLSAGLEAVDRTVGEFQAGAGMAELLKHGQAALNQIEKANSQALNHLLCTTIQALNLAAFSQSTRMLSDISEALLNTYTSNQISLIKALSGTTSDFLDTCCKVNQLQDLAVAEANYLTEVQKDLRDWTTTSAQFADQVKASYNAWSERTIDLYCRAG